jgi:hypothetical protein
VEVDLNWYLQLYLIAVEYRVDSFESQVVDLVKSEIFLNDSNKRIFTDHCTAIENL